MPVNSSGVKRFEPAASFTFENPPTSELQNRGTGLGSALDESSAAGADGPKIKSRTSASEARLRAAMQSASKIASKAAPRISGTSDPTVRLNGAVQVIPSYAGWDEPTQEVVKCRHFAHEFATHRGKKRELMLQLSTRQGITDKFDGELSNTHEAFYKIVREAQPSCKHLVDNHQFGHYLMALANALGEAKFEPLETQEVHCFLLTENHAMALHMEKKVKGGIAYVAAKLYDPNHTASYMRVERLSHQALSHVTLSHMLIDHHYRPQVVTAVCLDHRVQPEINRNPITPCARRMFLALRTGSADDLRAMLETSDGAGRTSIGLVNEMLKIKLDGVSALGYAMQDGYSAAAMVITNAVLDSRLRDRSKARLLAVGVSKVPALHIAFFSGRAELVQAFTHAVLASDLSDKWKIWLLRAEALTSSTRTGLAMARCQGHEQTAHLFVDAVQQSDLSGHDKWRLSSTD